MSIFDKFKYKRMSIPKTPKYGVSDAHKKRIKKELNNAETRLKRLSGGGSYVERPPRTDSPQLPIRKNYRFKYDYDYTPFNAPFPPTMEEMVRKGYIPPDWNREIKEENPALDLIHSYKAELDSPYISSIYVKDVIWILDEIEKTLKEDL